MSVYNTYYNMYINNSGNFFFCFLLIILKFEGIMLVISQSTLRPDFITRKTQRTQKLLYSQLQFITVKGKIN